MLETWYYYAQHSKVLLLLVRAPGVAIWSSLGLSAGTLNSRQKRWYYDHLYSQTGLVTGSPGAGMTSFLPALLCKAERQDCCTGASGKSLSRSEGFRSHPNLPCQFQSLSSCLSKNKYPRDSCVSMVCTGFIQRYYHHAGKLLFD